MNHALLAFSCCALLLVIAVQDFLVIPLRNETVSAGLTGPYHVLLDASYVPLSLALLLGFSGWMEVFAAISAVALLFVAATNTAWRFFDVLTEGEHALWHSRCTLIVFASAIALQVSGDHSGFWALTMLNIIIPGVCYAYFHFKPTTIKGVTIEASPAAEKLYIFFLCLWLIIWAVTH